MTASNIGAVTGLWCVISGAKHPLMSCRINMGIPVERCTCTVVPVIGQNGFGETASSDWVAAIVPGTSAVIEMDWLQDEKTTTIVLFEGFTTVTQFSSYMGSVSVGGAVGLTITFAHKTAMLGAVALGEREFIPSGSHRPAFTGEPLTSEFGAVVGEGRFGTKALMETRIATHIRDILDLLTQWYTNTTESPLVDVKALVKASTSPAKDIIGDSKEALIGGVRQTTYDAVQGALASRGTLLGIFSALAQYSMLVMVPRLRDCVLVPDVPVHKFTEGLILEKANVVQVARQQLLSALPIARIRVHSYIPYPWQAQSLQSPQYRVNLEGDAVPVSSTYPPEDIDAGRGGTLLLDIPPILKNLLNLAYCTTAASDKEVVPIGQDPTVNTTGATQTKESSTVQKQVDGATIGTEAAKMLYGIHAASAATASVSLVPSYVFSGTLRTDVLKDKITWTDDSIYSPVGHCLRFNVPINLLAEVSEPSFVGYVNGMSVAVNCETAMVNVELQVSHVRTLSIDEKHSIKKGDHPLYETPEGAVE